jgi:hypothetical protein
MDASRQKGSEMPRFLMTDPAAGLSESADPSTARVSGVELGEEFRLTYDWLEDQLETTTQRLTVTTHGGSLRHAGLIDEPELSELNDGLSTMELFPNAYDTPADLLAEFVARKYTLGRREYERIRRLDQRLRVCQKTLSRADEQESAEAVKGVLITLGEQLLALGAFLFQRYDTFEPSEIDPDALPLFPNPRRADAVTRVLSAYVEALPRAGASETLLAAPPGPVDGVEDARDTLAMAAAAIFYARWDCTVDDAWPLPVDQYPITFAEPSPVTGMESVTEYKAEGILNDIRAFDNQLAESATRFYDGVYLDQFRTIAHRYREIISQIADE